MKTPVFHAGDISPKPGQITVTTVCFKRVPRSRYLHVALDQVTCVGCRAILYERAKEEERARLR